jgi:cell wall-associated NlpC family hydrolase
MDVDVKFDTAISLEEEKAQKEAEEKARKEAEEAAKKLAAAKEAEKKKAAEAAKAAEEAAKQTDSSASETTTSVTSASRDALVSYAKQWVGVSPYVYGGTSLTDGIDCSAFVQACYKNALGVSISRTSRSQAADGKSISLDDVQPGDLVFYADGSGTICHVAMYIGNGQVVHASSPKSGTIISNMYYRTPYCAATFLN